MNERQLKAFEWAKKSMNIASGSSDKASVMLKDILTRKDIPPETVVNMLNKVALIFQGASDYQLSAAAWLEAAVRDKDYPEEAPAPS